MSSICTPRIILKRTRKNTRASNTDTTKGRQNSQIVQQHHHNTKPTGTVCICLDPTSLNQALIKANMQRHNTK